MRKLIYSMMVSLDGYIEAPDAEIDWGIIDEELHRFANQQAQESGAFLYGRRMYETMAGFWPTADKNPAALDYELEFARIWLEKPKVVFSKTLDQVDWNSRLVRENAVDEAKKLLAQPGPDLAVSGANLAATFLRLGLIDELQPIIHPVVLGGGKPFLPALDRPLTFKLLETRKFGTGVVFLRYQRAGDKP
jgi:dihydrofolate reductase